MSSSAYGEAVLTLVREELSSSSPVEDVPPPPPPWVVGSVGGVVGGAGCGVPGEERGVCVCGV